MKIKIQDRDIDILRNLIKLENYSEKLKIYYSTIERYTLAKINQRVA